MSGFPRIEIGQDRKKTYTWESRFYNPDAADHHTLELELRLLRAIGGGVRATHEFRGELKMEAAGIAEDASGRIGEYSAMASNDQITEGDLIRACQRIWTETTEAIDAVYVAAKRVQSPVAPHFEFVSGATDAQRAAGLPKRATAKSAGYDFTAPADVTIQPGEMITFATGIKACMPPDVVLLLIPRSSLGINRGIVLANGTGVIDADFADNPGNEGNIMAALRNTCGQPQTIRKGERYMQGIFVHYMTTSDDAASAQRRGGIGSTD